MTSRATHVMVVVAVTLASVGCDEELTSPSPSMGVCIIFVGSTTRRTNLAASAQDCINAVGVTHIHPSWRSFAAVPLQAVPPDLYEITFDDVPRVTPVSFRINDQNWSDENPTCAVTRNEKPRARRTHFGNRCIKAERVQRATSTPSWFQAWCMNSTMPASGREPLARSDSTSVVT